MENNLLMMKRLKIRSVALCILIVLASVFTFFSCEQKKPPPPDFAEIDDIDQKKAAFFSFLSPIITDENATIRQQRARLKKIYESAGRTDTVPFRQKTWLKTLADDYGVRLKGTAPTANEWQELLRRVDTVPKDLVLVQAAIESAWGTSRFAREGHNFFGEHCSSEGCGIVPEARPPGQTWEVAKFESAAGSVRSYLYNLNTHEAYEGLRILRQRLRKKGKRPDGITLAKALEDYSERGHDYVAQVRSMIRANKGEMTE